MTRLLQTPENGDNHGGVEWQDSGSLRSSSERWRSLPRQVVHSKGRIGLLAVFAIDARRQVAERLVRTLFVVVLQRRRLQPALVAAGDRPSGHQGDLFASFIGAAVDGRVVILHLDRPLDPQFAG